jgi:carboxyl-terminal processing protease
MEDQLERYDNGELYAPDSSIFVDSLKFKTPKGKTVYGGGGIMPDIFVPYDSTGTSDYLTTLRYSQVFSGFAFDFVQTKRSQWPSPESFNKQFKVTDELINSLAAFAEEEMHIPIDSKGLAHSKTAIAQSLKAEIARQIWMEEGFYQVFNSTDREFNKALMYLMR